MIYRASVRADPGYGRQANGLADAARATLEHESASSGDVAVVLTSEEHIRELNRSFRAEDSATDVLSFPDGQTDPDTGRVYFGDVILCVPIAEAQARRAGHSLQSELQLLTVHGVLHLLGHDHATRSERLKMWAAQDEVLLSLVATEAKVRDP